jgi:type I restriction enzyme M protein
VENDGFGLGAQRREVTGEQLTQVKIELELYLQAVRNQELTDNLELTLGLVVPKVKIAANGDYNFSGERYREIGASLSEYPHVALREICEINPETANLTELYPDSFFNYIDISCVENESGNFLGANKLMTNEAPSRARRLVKQNDVLLSTVRPNLKAFTILLDVPDRAIASTGFAVLRANSEQLHSGFLIAMLRHENSVNQMIGMMGKGAYPSINQSDVESIQIPLPPIAIQQEIVTEIESYQKVINGARAVIDNYRPHIPINSDWAMLKLGEICRFIDYRGKTPTKTSSGIPLITAKNVREGYINPEPREFIATEDYDIWMTRGIPKIGDVLFTTEAPLGNVAEINIIERFALAQRLIALCPNREILIGAFLKDLLLSKSLQDKIIAHQSGTTVYGIKASVLKEITVPVPPLEIQKAIVAEIEAEQTLVNANRELITRFEKKIQTTLNRIWGEE